MLFHGGVGFSGGGGIQRRKRLPQGRTGGRAGRQTDSAQELLLPPPTPYDSQKVLFLVLSPTLSLCVKFELSPWVERVEGSGLNLRQAQTEADTRHQIKTAADARRHERRGAHALRSAVSLPRQHRGDGPSPRCWLGGPPTAAPGFTGARLYLLEQMYSASFSAFPQVSPSVCRPILFTGKQQHLFVYMVI